jgi:protein-disulfide isomerase
MVPTPTLASSIKLSTLSLADIPQHDETLGNPHAPVKMVYFDDPQCPFCLEWQTQVLPTLVRKYVATDKLQIQWHGYAVLGPASVAGEKFIAAAGLQNRLWNVLDDILVNQGEEKSGWLTQSLLEQVGASIPGFDIAKAVADADSPRIAREIVADVRQGNRDHLEGVPFIQLGHRRGPLRTVNSVDYTPRTFEGPINHLLHKP